MHLNPSLLSVALLAKGAAGQGHSGSNHGGVSKNPFNTPDRFSTDDSSVKIPHRGCADFLKTNHKPQNLAPVNFRGRGNNNGGGGGGGGRSLQNTENVTCTNGFADTGSAQYACSNLDLMSFIPLAELGLGSCPGGSVNGNDIWGWTDSVSGREFALMGLTTGTSFVEITDPLNPVFIGTLDTHTSSSSWRDVKTYADHAFIVSEASGHGMQVFDLTQLLTVVQADMPVDFINTAHYSGFGNAHNIVINEDSGYAYGVGTNQASGGLHIVDITTPTVPVFAGQFSADGYTHDAQCLIYNGPDTDHTNKEICFNYNEDTLTIVDVSDKTSPVELSRLGYSGASYTHQGWLTDDGNHVLVNDETDENGSVGTKTHVFSVRDLDNPSYNGFHEGTTPAIDHNLYVKGNLVFQANYRAGLQVLTIGNLDASPPALTQVANFDIFIGSDSNNFNGAWSNYPYFPSGNIIISGIEQGLYVVKSPNNYGQGARRAVRKRDLVVADDRLHREEDERLRKLETTCSLIENFDSKAVGSNGGWTTSGSCSTGTFEIGTPTQMADQCVLTQPGGDHTSIISGGTGYALYSQPNTAAGTNDIDGGECVATSPTYTVAAESDLSAWYFHGQRTSGDDNGDYFRLELSVDAGSSWASMVEIGDISTDAWWREATAVVPGGSQVQLRIRASDGSAAGDLVEAGIDDVTICASGTAAPTGSPTGSPTAPTTSPTRSPTKMPVPPTSSPTNNPTLSPTTGKPTTSPTSRPTEPPTGFNCGTITKSKTCRNRAGCVWNKRSRSCVAN